MSDAAAIPKEASDKQPDSGDSYCITAATSSVLNKERSMAPATEPDDGSGASAGVAVRVGKRRVHGKAPIHPTRLGTAAHPTHPMLRDGTWLVTMVRSGALDQVPAGAKATETAARLRSHHAAEVLESASKGKRSCNGSSASGRGTRIDGDGSGGSDRWSASSTSGVEGGGGPAEEQDGDGTSHPAHATAVAKFAAAQLDRQRTSLETNTRKQASAAEVTALTAAHSEALRQMLTLGEQQLTVLTLCRVHAAICEGDAAALPGRLRQTTVRAGSRTCCAPNEVPGRLELCLKVINELVSAPEKWPSPEVRSCPPYFVRKDVPTAALLPASGPCRIADNARAQRSCLLEETFWRMPLPSLSTRTSQKGRLPQKCSM
jgi:hypothetical protein